MEKMKDMENRNNHKNQKTVKTDITASAIFVGKASCESTVRYRVKSRIPSCLFRYSLDPNLSRLCLASLICLCMLTVGVGNAWGADADSGTDKFSETSGSLDSYISYSCAKSGGTNAPAVYDSRIRLYRYNSSTTGLGSTLTVSASDGAKITSITFTITSSLGYSISVDGGSATTGTASSITKSSINASSVTLQNYSTSQMNVKRIQVTYTAPTPCTITWHVNGNTTTAGSPTVNSTTGSKVATLPTAPLSAACDGSKVFVGWTETAIVGTTNTKPSDLFINAAGAPTLTQTATHYYAVFADEDVDAATVTFGWESADDATKWTLSNLSSKASYNSYKNSGSYAGSTGSSETASIKYNTKISPTAISCKYTKATGNTNSSSKFIIQTSTDGSSWTNKQNGKTMNNVTQGTFETLSWSGTLTDVYVRVYYTGTSATRVLDDVSITYSSTTYSNYATSCCDELGYIKGSVAWTNGSKATLLWDKMSNVDATTPYTITYRTGSAAYGNTNVSAIRDTISNTKKTCTITGLTAGTSYDFKIAVTAASNYCDKDSVMTSKAPLITASATLTGSDYAYGSGPGTEKSFTVSGVGLTGDITVTAPTNFEVSTTSGKSYSSSVVLSPSEGTLSSTTVYIRLAAGKAVGTYSASAVTISGGGAANNTSVTIAGTVSEACSVPTIGDPELTSITGTTITVSCPTISGGTNCDVDEYGFIWKAGSAPTMASYDGKKKTGENNQSTAYNDGLSIDVANNTGTTYYIKAYAHNSAGNNVSSTALQVTPQSVTFNSNGGSSVTTKYVNNGGTVSKPSDPTKSNYDFDDWYTDDGTFESNVDFSSTITEDKTYYANWTETLHDVTVEYKCGSTTVKASTTIENVGVVKTGSTTAPNDITGYTWSTWSAMPSGVTTSTTPLTIRTITINATADGKTITANYTANQYDITYKDEGDAAYSGNNSGSLPSIHTYGSATALVNGAKSGYDFVGWFTDAACTESAGGSIGATAKTTAFTLYAKWAPSKYDVTLKKNGKTAAADQVVRVTYGSAMPDTIKAVGNTAITVPTQNGYTFKGYWDTSASTGGKQYYSYSGTPAVLESANNWDKTSDTNLYGRWEANQYTVTLDANGGVDGATTSVTATYDADMPTIATANLPTRAGYRFDGFYTGKTDGTKYYNADGTSAKNQARYSAGQVLYAHWVAQLTFSVNGDIDDELTRDDNTAMPSTAAVPTACGDCWAFMGWSTDPDEDGAPEYAGGATHEFGSPTTLYAVFGKAEYKLISDLSDLEANDYYVLSSLNSNEYAMSNTTTDTYYATSVDITSDLKENADGWYLYNPPVSVIWKFTGTTSSGRLYNEAASKYLDLSSDNATILQSSTSDYLKFTKFDSELFNIASTTQTSYFLYMYSGNKWFVDDDHDGYSSCYIYKRQSATYATEPNCETYDIVWKVNGTPLSSGSQTEETNACAGIEELPTDPDDDELDCATKFVGWSEQELVGEGHDAPADLFTAIEDAPAIDEDKTFHAVFATSIGTPIAAIEDTEFSSKDESGGYCNATYSFKATGKYLQKQSIWTSSNMTDVKVRIRVYHVSNNTADVLRVSLINSSGAEVVGADLTTSKLGNSITSAGGWSAVVELTPTTAVTGYKVSMKTKNSYGTGIDKIEREVVASGLKDYMTTCCDKNITLSNPTITDAAGSGATITFDKSSPVATCGGETTVTATLTLPAGYEATALSFSGGSVSVSPEISLPVTATTVYTLTFDANTNATLTTTATVAAKTANAWNWTYNGGAIPDPLVLYVGINKQLDVTYTPADLLNGQKNYTVTKESSVAEVGKAYDHYTMRGAAGVTTETNSTVTFSLNGLSQTVNVTVKPQPRVHFVDIVHGESFADVGPAVESYVATFIQPTPTHSDISDPGENYNSCERGHLHLLGWIESTWADEHPNATHSEITGANASNGEGTFLEAGADFNVETYNGKTYYAVWSIIE